MAEAGRQAGPAGTEEEGGGAAADLTPAHGLAAAVAAAAFVLAVVAVMERLGVPAAVLLRDPASQLGFWPFYGFLSHLGVFLLAAAGTVAVFVAVYGNVERGLLASIGALSLMLAADDFLMLHEHFFPNRGIPERAVFAVYALWGIATVALHRAVLLQRRAAAFWLAVALLGGSAAVDTMQRNWEDYLVLEDTLKLCGIAVWAAFWIRRAGGSVRQATRPT